MKGVPHTNRSRRTAEHRRRAASYRAQGGGEGPRGSNTAGPATRGVELDRMFDRYVRAVKAGAALPGGCHV